MFAMKGSYPHLMTMGTKDATITVVNDASAPLVRAETSCKVISGHDIDID
jgi:hypothetical protein